MVVDIPLKLDAWGELTPGQRRVATHVLNGLSTQEVADLLGLSYGTVNCQQRNIYVALGIRTRQQLFRALLFIPRLACDERGQVTIQQRKEPNDIS